MTTTNYAGFWLRFVAYLIDYIIISIIQSFIFIPILGMLGFSFAMTNGFDFSDFSDEDSIAMVIAAITAMSAGITLTFFLQLFYYAAMEASKYQATVGKILLGLKVTDMNGQRISLGVGIIRNLGKILSSLIMLIGYIMAGFTEKKQALHDIMAGALVVKQ